jgi:hypothetical protein
MLLFLVIGEGLFLNFVEPIEKIVGHFTPDIDCASDIFGRVAGKV